MYYVNVLASITGIIFTIFFVIELFQKAGDKIDKAFRRRS